MATEHGFMKPNPALLSNELNRKKTPKLAHQLGEGSPCQKCNEKCPGFQLHFWRKVCSNCRCGKIEHNVIDPTDHGDLIVGKIFDRPLRTRSEELEFCFGEEDGDFGHVNTPKVRFDWVPQNISKNLVRRYMKQMPEDYWPIAGTQAASQRQRNLERQFPVYDIEPNECHDLTSTEFDNMTNYISNVKDNIAGVGIVHEVGHDEQFPPPPSPEILKKLLEQELAACHLQDQPVREIDDTEGNVNGSNGIMRNNNANGHHDLTSNTNEPRKLGQERVETPNAIEKHLNGNQSEIAVKNCICNFCHEILHLGDVAIRAERAGRDERWHPQCFRCSECQEILVDLLYYYEDGALYCGRDYARLRCLIPRCGACDELIFAADYTGAEGKTWHLKHFCCWICDQPLAGLKYVSLNDGQPHCLNCYQKNHGKICQNCREYIDPELQRISLDDVHWHATTDCFQCAVCSKTLLGSKIIRAGSSGVVCSSVCRKKITNVD